LYPTFRGVVVTAFDLAIVGLGYVGMPLAKEATAAGLRVVGLDVDPRKVESLTSGRSYIDDLSDADLDEMLRSGFTATLSVTNLGDALKNWTLEWDFPGDQKVTGSWNTHVAQTGRHVALRNVAHNASLAKGATVTPGVQGTHSGAVTMPTAFKLNGRTCAVVPSSAAPAVRSADARAAAERAADPPRST